MKLFRNNESVPGNCAPKDNVYRVAIDTKFKNIAEHTERMKQLYWKDCDEACYKET